MRRRVGLLAAVALFAGTVPAARGDGQDDPIWKRLVDPKDPAHAEALAEWKALAEPKRAERVRVGLRSSDRVTARFAAELAHPFTLDLEEIRRALGFCATDPAWVADPFHDLAAGLASDGLGFGLPDVPAMWRTAATTEGFAFVIDPKFGSPSEEFHRATDASQARDLVPLLETKNDDVRRRLAHDLWLVADVTVRDETRPILARGFLYLLARDEAVKAGKPLPALASIEPRLDGPGVPEALKTLVRDAVRENAAWMAAPEDRKPRSEGPHPWLVRWARQTSPVAEDLPFLEEVARAAGGLPALRSWSIRAAAALDPKGEHFAWPLLAEKDDDVAAAELARRGKPERLRAMADAEGRAGRDARILSFEVDPDRARARYLEALGKDDASAKDLDLSPFQRAAFAIEWGVEVRDADLRAIGALLAEGESPRRGCAWFFGHAIPEAITPEIALAMAKRLRATSDDFRSGAQIDLEDLDVTLAALEVRAPDVLYDLLHAWAKGPAGEKQERALVLLARLGDATFVDAMLASWAGEDGWSTDALYLGRVKDARVPKFLRARLVAGTPENTVDELQALAVYEGFPEAYRWILWPNRDGSDAEFFSTVRARLLAGDVDGARRALVEDGSGIDHLPELGKPEALEALRRIRRDRFVRDRAAYWPATKALAAAGDTDARRAWLGLLRDGRVRMNDGKDLLLPGALATDPEVLQAMIALLDSNCCLGWQAHVGLKNAYPTAPMGNIGPLLARNRFAAEPWFARHRGTFAWSRILDGYVPGPSKR